MRGRKASYSGRARSEDGARAPRGIGADALRVEAAMATRLRVAVVGQASPPDMPPELIKISLDGDARRPTIVASERRSSMGRG